MALALPRWIRAFDWPTLALIRERPNTRVSLRLRRNTLTAPTPPRGGTYLSKSSPPMYYPAPTRVRLHCSARTSPRSRHQLRRAVAPTFPRALHPCTTLHQPASACIAPHEQALARRMGGGRPPHQCTHGPDAQPHRCPVHPPHSPPTFCRTPLSCRLSWELEQGLKLKKEQVFFLISMTNS